MSRSKREQQIDQLIGEAVLSILYDNGPISTRSLIEKLQAMEASERDAQRRNLIADVIADISHQRLGISRRNSVSAQQQWDMESPIQQKNKAYQLFDDSPDPGSSKKH